MVIDLGAVLDPFADKLMLMSVIIVFTISGYIPVFILIIILTKELFMIYGEARFYFAKKKIVIPANKYGKASTVLFYVSIIVITFNISDIANNILMFSVVISTIIAFVSYYKIARNEMKKW